MRRTCVVRAAGALLGLALALPAFAAPRAMNTSVELEPAAEPGTYEARVEIRDAATGDLLAAPRVLFREGEPAKVTIGSPDAEQIVISIAVDAATATATYRAEVTDASGGAVVQRASIRLAR